MNKIIIIFNCILIFITTVSTLTKMNVKLVPLPLKTDCEHINFDGNFFGFDVTLIGDLCQNKTNDGDWYIDANLTVKFLGVNLLTNKIHIDNKHPEECFDLNVGITSLHICLEIVDSSIIVSGKVCGLGNCREFKEVIVNWGHVLFLVKNENLTVKDEEEEALLNAFLDKHVYIPGKSAADYVRSYGSNRPQIVTVLKKIPNIDDYELINNNPKYGYKPKTKNTIESDNFSLKKHSNETKYRCRNVKSNVHPILCFNSRKQPYHLDASGVDKSSFEGSSYIFRCLMLKEKDMDSIDTSSSQIDFIENENAPRLLCNY